MPRAGAIGYDGFVPAGRPFREIPMKKSEPATDAPEIEQAETVEPPGEAGELLELLIAERDASPPQLASRIDGIVVGRVCSIDAGGAIRVTFAGTPDEGFGARAMIALEPRDQGQEVALMFEGGDPHRPVVLGKMVSPLASGANEASADGRRVEIRADEEIVLRCGEASLTLTRAGKIVLRGAYVLSRASGVNRIQGGSVEIN